MNKYTFNKLYKPGTKIKIIEDGMYGNVHLGHILTIKEIVIGEAFGPKIITQEYQSRFWLRFEVKIIK